MRVLVQRSGECEVWIDSEKYSQTKPGLLLLFGTRQGDLPESAAWLAEKAVNLRIFEDDQGKMNLSALELQAEIMIVSQLTITVLPAPGFLILFQDLSDIGHLSGVFRDLIIPSWQLQEPFFSHQVMNHVQGLSPVSHNGVIVIFPLSSLRIIGFRRFYIRYKFVPFCIL